MFCPQCRTEYREGFYVCSDCNFDLVEACVHRKHIQAGRELAREGQIRYETQRRANQEIIPVPFFGLLKRLPFKSLKRRFIEEARKMGF